MEYYTKYLSKAAALLAAQAPVSAMRLFDREHQNIHEIVRWASQGPPEEALPFYSDILWDSMPLLSGRMDLLQREVFCKASMSPHPIPPHPTPTPPVLCQGPALRVMPPVALPGCCLTIFTMLSAQLTSKLSGVHIMMVCSWQVVLIVLVNILLETIQGECRSTAVSAGCR